MFKFQLESIKAFRENIINIKLNDKVKLNKEYNNKLSKDAIGVYYLNKKIGYAPFIFSQNIDLNLDYKIIHINLSKLEIIVGCAYQEKNYLDIIRPDNSNCNIDNNHDLLLFKKKLEILGFVIYDNKVLYADENFIDINIKSKNNINVTYYTVTKKYYDNNLIKYNEFYDNKLIKYNVYVSFFTHRLEEYIYKKYKQINKNIQSDKLYYNHIKQIYWFE